MPRTTAQTQFHRYQRLNESYFGDDRPLSYLGQIPQAELYAFYQHHVDGHTEESLRAHQAGLHRTHPSLAHRAGKHYRQFVILTQMLEDRRQEEIMRHGKRPWVPPAERQIAVRPVFLPHMNVEKFAKALLLLVDENKRIKGMHQVDASSGDDASSHRDAA